MKNKSETARKSMLEGVKRVSDGMIFEICFDSSQG
jgi:hypothetical protein